MKEFLAQPVVHKYMRSEWVGGGFQELYLGDFETLRNVVLSGLFGWPLIIPYNLCIALIVSVVPDFEHWYIDKYKCAPRLSSHGPQRTGRHH